MWLVWIDRSPNDGPQSISVHSDNSQRIGSICLTSWGNISKSDRSTGACVDLIWNHVITCRYVCLMLKSMQCFHDTHSLGVVVQTEHTGDF